MNHENCQGHFEWEGTVLVDGGLIDMLPAIPAKENGADVVIEPAVRNFGWADFFACKEPFGRKKSLLN